MTKYHQGSRRQYLRDGSEEGILPSVCRTRSTSPSLLSVFTSPGTESSTQSCSAPNKIYDTDTNPLLSSNTDNKSSKLLQEGKNDLQEGIL
jgi:hypothetical protein